MKEKCGVFGIYSKKNDIQITNKVIQGLNLLQHRGQEGCGIAYDNSGTLIVEKGLGLVKTFFNNNHNALTNKCIGHVRYSTSGDSKNNNIAGLNECQPLIGNTNDETFYLVHNGNIPNIKIHDTKYIIDCINSYLDSNFENKLINLLNTIPAAYCLIILKNDCLYAIRDSYGIRPLCIGTNNNSYCISSESCALQNHNFLRDVYPGEIIKIDNTGLSSIYKSPNSQLSICAFEYLYFLNPDSICDGLKVRDLRNNLGITIAKNETLILDDEFIVIGIPNSGIISAKSYANKLDINYKQAIIKNKNINRTFIIPNNLDRKKACNKKFIYYKDEIKDKKVIIIDDTIVRGNVMKSIIKNLWLNSAKEIHIRVAAPPIIDICQLGIDIPSCKELIAYNKNIEQLKDIFNVTSIRYISLDDLNNLLPEKSYKQCFGVKIDKNMLI